MHATARLLVGGVLAALVAGSCSVPPAAPEIRFGGGLVKRWNDGPGLDLGPLTDVDRWVEVVAPAPEFTDEELIGTGGGAVVRVRVAPVRSVTDVGRPRLRRIDFQVSEFPGIAWALSTGGRPFLALVEPVEGPPIVSYVLIRTAEGGHFFAGDGAYPVLTHPARWRFGDRYDEVLDRLIGLTHPRAIERLLEIE